MLVPSYQGIEYETQDLLDEIAERGATIKTMRGLGLIDRVRSHMASMGLASPFKRWLWLDADMVLDIHGVQQLVDVAERDDHDILSALYMTRQPGGRPAAEFFAASDTSVAWPHVDRAQIVCGQQGGLYPVKRVGFGAVVTHRRVFEALAKTMPQVDYGSQQIGWPFFACITDSGGYVGEDYSFCDRARAAGFRVTVDTRVRVGHVGKYVYRWEDANRIEPSPTVIMQLI